MNDRNREAPADEAAEMAVVEKFVGALHGAAKGQPAAEVIAGGAKLLALGGDHFVAWPLLRAHAARYGPLALVQVDAHGDLWPDDPGRIDHGRMMGRAVGQTSP